MDWEINLVSTVYKHLADLQQLPPQLLQKHLFKGNSIMGTLLRLLLLQVCRGVWQSLFVSLVRVSSPGSPNYHGVGEV